MTISPSGGDDTSALQNGINSTAAAGNTLQLNAGSFHTNSLTFPNHANISLVSGVTVTATSSVTVNPLLLIGSWSSGTSNANTSSNVTISGAGASSCIFTMTKPTSGTTAQPHGLMIYNATNINISGCSFNNFGGDGIYIRQANTVAVNNCTCNNNSRQGCSITGVVNGINLTGCTFSNTTRLLPSAGIDIEPNSPADFLLNINISSCTTSHNAGDGILVSLQQMDSTSQPVSIYVYNTTSSSDGGGVGTSGGWAGFRGLNAGPGSNAGGWVLFEDCASNSSAFWAAIGRFWAANGAALIFKNLSVNNPHVNGPDTDYHDSAAVGTAGGAGNPASGNVHFLNPTITVTNGRVDRYFNFATNGTNGVTNVRFVPGSGTLSGASSSSMGAWQGSASGAIN